MACRGGAEQDRSLPSGTDSAGGGAAVNVTLLEKWRLLQGLFADARLSQSSKVVAGVLLDHLNTATRQCNPSLGVIEARCGLKRRQVCAAIKALREHGVIGQRRRRGASAYAFNF